MEPDDDDQRIYLFCERVAECDEIDGPLKGIAEKVVNDHTVLHLSDRQLALD